jgi:deoxyribodipyrimidine photolyase-related protein
MAEHALVIVFPHQLLEQHPALAPGRPVLLVEEFLFFRQYTFHQRKLWLHRSSMRCYADFLREQGYTVRYIDSLEPEADIRALLPLLRKEGIRTLHYADPCDNWLEKRLNEGCREHDLEQVPYDSPQFLNTSEELRSYFKGKTNYLQADFYRQQRRQRQVLLLADGKPLGGQWSFDADNRLRYPKGKTPPSPSFPAENIYTEEARNYVQTHYSTNPGSLEGELRYPTSFGESRLWLQEFIGQRFEEFGPYEDAMVVGQPFLHHSVLTPMLNIGLLTPQQVLEAALRADVPLNSKEGFLRQVMGWREFVRGVYLEAGSRQRTRNFWGFTRRIPESFYTGTTSIVPVDEVIQTVLKTGYCHHIERLMVLGNFMLLCEFDPDEVYRWFMELFIDAYDWVMVPNVYGMSQFSDGGLLATKPYLSGSNYLKKMSDFPPGPWQATWDGLFWRFMHVHRDFFLQNPRLGMLIRTFDKMSADKQRTHLTNADEFLGGMVNY